MWVDVIRGDIRKCGVNRGMEMDRLIWWDKIRKNF